MRQHLPEASALSQEALHPLGSVLAPQQPPPSSGWEATCRRRAGGGNAEALGTLRMRVGTSTRRKNHTARAPGSDINIFWKLPVHSGAAQARPAPPSVFPGCSSQGSRGVSREVGGRVRGLGGGIRNGSIRDCYLQLGASGSSSGALGMWGGGRRATGDRGWNGGPEEVHVSHTPGFALPCPSQTYSTPAAPKNTGWTVPRPFGKIKCRKWEGVRAGRRGEVGGGAGVWEVGRACGR